MINILACLVAEGLLPTAVGYELTPLTGGFWNDVYRLRGNGRNWVIKHFRAANSDSLYPILPQTEALALRTLRGLDIAPEPVAFLADVPLLVYEFFEGDVWWEDVAAVGRLLRRLHDVSVLPDSGFRYLPVEPEAIMQQGDRFLAQAEQGDLVRQLELVRPSATPRPPLARLSLVHTDTWVGNFVQNGRSLRLIDWQCPGLGDPAEDVWTFLYSGYEMLLGWPRFEAQVAVDFWRGYGRETAVSQHLPYLAPYYTYRLAAHCCLRQQQLAAANPTASQNYQKIFAWLMTNLTT